jgi:hypothetical protein
MPIVAYPDDANPAGLAVPPGAPGFDLAPEPEPEAPSFLATAAAALRQESDVVSIGSSKLVGVDLVSKEDGFTGETIWNEIAGTPYEPYFDRFADAMNRPAFNALKAQIDMETEDRRTLDAAGWWGTLASAAASLVSPTTLLPGGPIVRGVRLGRSVLQIGVRAALAEGLAQTANEIALQSSQQTRPIEQSVLNVGAGVLLAGTIGAGAGAVFSRAERKAALRAIERAHKPKFDAETDVLHRELTDIATGNRSVGAAVMKADTLDDLTIAGTAARKVAETTAFMNPMLRTLTSPSRAVRAIAAQLMDAPVYLRKNFEGRGDIAAETSMLEFTRGAVGRALDAQRAAFLEGRKAGLSMTARQFREEVGRAMRRGDKAADPAVQKAAAAWRSTVFEPLKERAVKAGLLPEGVKVVTAESYFSRIYNKPKIVAQEPRFKTIVRDWLHKALDQQLLSERRVADARISNRQAEIRDLEMGMQRRSTALQERIQGGEVLPDEFSENEIVDFARRIMNGERPKMPETFSEWIKRLRKDGIYDPKGDLAAVYPELKRIPGMLRSSRKARQNPKGGIGLDDLALRARDEGFLQGDPPSIGEFLDALDEDLKGNSVVRADDAGQARMVADFDQVERAMQRSGIDFGKVRLATSEAMKNVATAVNRSLDDMDQARISRLNEDIAEAGRRGQFEFVSDADRAAYLDDAVNSVFDTVTSRQVDGMLNVEIPASRSGVFKERTFNIPDALIEDFLEHDVELIGRRYARLMAGDVELTERFGDVRLTGPLQAIADDYNALRAVIEADTSLSPEARGTALQQLAARERADKRDLEGVRDTIRGNYRAEDQHTNFARVAQAARMFNYMRALGGVALASLTDVVRPAMVHGLGNYMRDFLMPLIRNVKAVKMSRDEARIAGAVTEHILHGRLAQMAELTDPYAAGMPVERFLENAAVGFGKLTGLSLLNDMNKAAASIITQARILRNAELTAATGFDSLPKAEQAYMGFLGLGRDRIGALADNFARHGETIDGVRVANSDAWDEDARRAFRAAVNKDADSIIVTPSAGDLPLFMRTPVGKTMAQFRSFAVASNQRVLIRGLQEPKARLWGGLVAMTAFGALVYALKQIEAGREVSDNPGTWISEGLDRSGILSLFFEVNNALEKVGAPGVYTGLSAAGQTAFPGVDARQPASRFATRSVVSGFLGPTVDLAERVVSLGGAAVRADLTPGNVGDLRQITPFASLPFWRWLIDGTIVPAAKEAVKQ